LLGQALAGFGEAVFGNGEALADFDWRRFVVNPDEVQIHD